jgi:adhesin transport system outer membrane protein
VATNLFANYNDEGQYHDYELWEENKKMGASLGITYLLLDAGGRKNTALAAKKGLNAANQAYNQSVLDLVFEVQKRYFAYVKALQMLAAKEQDLKVARLNRERAKDFFTAGLNSKSAQLQAQAHLSQVKYQMATIRGEVEQTWKGLACLCSLPVSPRHGVKSPPRLDRGLVCKGAKELVRLIKDKNPRLQALKAQISSEEHQVRAAKSRFAPELSLIGSATAQKVMATKRDQASTEENEYQATVGVKVTYDLFNGFSDCYELRQARSRAEAYRERYAESLLGLRQQVESALDSYQAAADQLRASKQYMQDCEANYKVALEFFNHGEGTMFEVTKSLEQLAQAKSERVGAKMDMYTAAASLAHSCGAFERLGAKQAKWQPMD